MIKIQCTEPMFQSVHIQLLCVSKAFLTYETDFVLFLGVQGKFCLAHDVKSDGRTLNFRTDVTRFYEKHRMTFVEGHYVMSNVINKRNDE